ncbi:MAG: sugar O-acyltransferase (sialic acid O-acetyltransferase NeuD family) [Phycisphaerales bacterium]|jgi:sugar O-acyltransferase (sialic acid O-acetyltransferase NeuD family)
MSTPSFKIPCWSVFAEDERLADERVLLSGKANYWSGEEGALFEQEFASWCGIKYGLCFFNGTVALEIALHSVGIQQGEEVIAEIGNNETRSQVLSGLRNIATIIHKDASVSSRTSLGEGTVVFAQAAINTGATIGRGCIVDTGATVDHDCNLDDGVHISPGANVGGGVTIGICSWVGIGASVKHGVTIGKNVTVRAGAAVVSDIPDNATVVGVPAKELTL